ncbi:MAG TPA: LysM peptidoglycan-binding domain-containing protein [Xanthomonadales bacterium]|nr:LysM peptidoglycan-binding domain-containing protein [Xanthomonadales bacterium]
MAIKRSTSKKSQKAPSVYDYLRFGESYTSLVLGIIVVIIGTVLLLSLVRTRNAGRVRSVDTQLSQSTLKISQTENETIISSATESAKPTSISTPTQTVKPTAKPTVAPKVKPTAVPTRKVVVTKAPKPTATPIPTKEITEAKPTTKPSKDMSHLQGRTYVAKAGDTLWNVAERNYGSGYNWVDIARANKLSNPDDVKVGQKLQLPKAEQKNATSEPEWTIKDASYTTTSLQSERITTGNYTIKKGDTLWDIAVRAYGDGYKWKDLARTNKLSNPDLILEGTKLNLPRK